MRRALLHVLSIATATTLVLVLAGWVTSYRRPVSLVFWGYRIDSTDGVLHVENRIAHSIARRAELQRLQAIEQFQNLKQAAAGRPLPPLPEGMRTRMAWKPPLIPPRFSVGYGEIFPPAILTMTLCLALEFALRRRRLRVKGICSHCGYDLRATPDCCPECGSKNATSSGRVARPRSSRGET